jgi:hypothetical protein
MIESAGRPMADEIFEPYKAPAVEVLGTVEELTACGSSAGTDFYGGGGGVPSGS